MRFQDLSGQSFGRLVVVELVKRGNVTVWRCRCACGKMLDVRAGNLKNGNSQSCGCLRDEIARVRATKHGAGANGQLQPEYKCWRDVIARCEQRNRKTFKHYGERGIKICAGWRDSYPSFARDMGPKPSPLHSIDRKDGSGGYDCGHCEDCRSRGVTKRNCRWATKTEQSNNTTRNVRLTFRGRTQTVAQWCDELGRQRSATSARLKRGWSVEDALTVPVRPLRPGRRT